MASAWAGWPTGGRGRATRAGSVPAPIARRSGQPLRRPSRGGSRTHAGPVPRLRGRRGTSQRLEILSASRAAAEAERALARVPRQGAGRVGHLDAGVLASPPTRPGRTRRLERRRASRRTAPSPGSATTRTDSPPASRSRIGAPHRTDASAAERSPLGDPVGTEAEAGAARQRALEHLAGRGEEAVGYAGRGRQELARAHGLLVQHVEDLPRAPRTDTAGAGDSITTPVRTRSDSGTRTRTPRRGHRQSGRHRVGERAAQRQGKGYRDRAVSLRLRRAAQVCDVAGVSDSSS